MVILPTQVSVPSRINPKRIILFSQPKVGKSEALSRLKDNLIIDFMIANLILP